MRSSMFSHVKYQKCAKCGRVGGHSCFCPNKDLPNVSIVSESSIQTQIDAICNPPKQSTLPALSDAEYFDSIDAEPD